MTPRSTCHSWLQPGPMCLQLPGSQPGSCWQNDRVIRGCQKVGQGEAQRKGVSTGQAREGLTAHTLCPRCRVPVNTLGLALCHQDEYTCADTSAQPCTLGPRQGMECPCFGKRQGPVTSLGSRQGACQSLRDGARPVGPNPCSSRAQVNTARMITEHTSWKEA